MRLAYSPYGLSEPPPENYCLAFNGELWQAAFQGYLLGNGRRPFSPILMRFMTADQMSPFGRGGLNTYAYCGGDPINNVDPSGHVFLPSKLAHAINSKFGRTLFNARHRAPLGGLGISRSKDLYKLHEKMKKGDVRPVVESIPVGMLDELMDAYPGQKVDIFREATNIADEKAQHYSSAPRVSVADFNLETQAFGMTVEDYSGVFLIATKSPEGLGSRQISPLLDAAWQRDLSGQKIAAILERRMSALRTGRAIASDDWHAGLDL